MKFLVPAFILTVYTVCQAIEEKKEVIQNSFQDYNAQAQIQQDDISQLSIFRDSHYWQTTIKKQNQPVNSKQFSSISSKNLDLNQFISPSQLFTNDLNRKSNNMKISKITGSNENKKESLIQKIQIKAKPLSIRHIDGPGINIKDNKVNYIKYSQKEKILSPTLKCELLFVAILSIFLCLFMIIYKIKNGINRRNQIQKNNNSNVINIDNQINIYTQKITKLKILKYQKQLKQLQFQQQRFQQLQQQQREQINIKNQERQDSYFNKNYFKQPIQYQQYTIYNPYMQHWHQQHIALEKRPQIQYQPYLRSKIPIGRPIEMNNEYNYPKI